MGVDAVGGPMKHRAQTQATFQGAPGVFHALELLVAQREILRVEAVIVGVDDELAVEPCLCPYLRAINGHLPPWRELHIAPCGRTFGTSTPSSGTGSLRG